MELNTNGTVIFSGLFNIRSGQMKAFHWLMNVKIMTAANCGLATGKTIV